MSMSGQAAGTVAAVVALWSFAVWTLFVWGSRIRNIVADGGGVGSLAVAALLVALGAGVAFVALTGRRRELVPLVLVHDHAGAFKVVHVLLAAVSVALALLAQRAQREVTAARATRRAPA